MNVKGKEGWGEEKFSFQVLTITVDVLVHDIPGDSGSRIFPRLETPVSGVQPP